MTLKTTLRMISYLLISMIFLTIWTNGKSITKEKEKADDIETSLDVLWDIAYQELKPIKINSYLCFDYEQSFVLDARLKLFWYYFVYSENERNISYFEALEEECMMYQEHFQIQDLIYKKKHKKDRLIFFGIGAGSGVILSTIGIIILRSLIN